MSKGNNLIPGTNQNGPPFLKLELSILRSRAFSEFIRSPEASIWFYLYGYTVRGKISSNGLGKRIYEEFYLKKKKIVARWDQRDIAINLGYSQKSKGYISRLLNELEKKWGLIKKIKIPSHNGHHLNLYEFGYIDDQGNEVLYFNTVFRKLVAEERLERFKSDMAA